MARSPDYLISYHFLKDLSIDNCKSREKNNENCIKMLDFHRVLAEL